MRQKQYTLKVATQTVNDEGVVMQTWQDVGTVVGLAIPDAAAAKQTEQGLVASARYKLYTKARAGIIVGNKITVDDNDLIIIAVNDYGRMREAILAEVVPGG